MAIARTGQNILLIITIGCVKIEIGTPKYQRLTTLARDLDEKKQLYLNLEIPEYWVVDVRGKRVLAFRLVDGKYQECSESIALAGLPIALLDQTLERVNNVNGNAALWFAAQIQDLPTRSE